MGLLLGAHEQHLTAFGHQIAHIGVSRLNVGKGLGQIDDVDAVALSEDETLHLRIPSAGLVSEVDPGIEQLTHGHDRRHGDSPLPAVQRNPGSAPDGDRGMPRAVIVFSRELLPGRFKR